MPREQTGCIGNMAKNLVQFGREVKQEAQKVTWPSRKETTTTTFVVFLMVVLFSLLLMFADWMISSAVEFILGFGR